MKRRDRGLALAVFAAAVVAGSGGAQAHLVSTGLGPIYDGATHFLLSPDELFAVAAVALLAGLRGSDHARWVFFAMPLAWLGGTRLGWIPAAGEQSALTAASLLGIGAILAADLKLSCIVIMLLGSALCLWHGSVDGAGFAAAGAGVLPLIGGGVTISIVTALTASLSLPLYTLWARTAVRVAGSWVAALGLLLVGWTIHAIRLHAS